jgi:hypothetical protein
MKIEQLNEKKHHDENKDLNKAPPIGKLAGYITSAQAAKMMGVTMGRIRQFVMDGRLKSYQPEKGRRDHLFKLSEIRAFDKKEREITGRPEEGKKKKKTVKESAGQHSKAVATVVNPISFKNGNILNPGDKVICILGDHSENPHPDQFVLLTDEKEQKIGLVRYINAHKYFKGFKAPPSERALWKMSDDGIATTPIGNRTEPDGYGPKGDPSWLIVLGLI